MEERRARGRKEFQMFQQGGKLSKWQALLAKCYECMNRYADGVGDCAMADTAARTGAGVVLMHMLGEPRTMQKNPVYENLYPEVIAFLEKRIEAATAAGVAPEKIIVDPGIGFGKTVGHNLELIRDLPRLRTLGRPILVGPSNKMFVGMVTGADISDRTPGTGAAVTACVLNGAHILRVHDIAAMRPFVEMGWAVLKGSEY